MKSLIIFALLIAFALCEVKIPDEYKNALRRGSKNQAEIEKRIAGGEASQLGAVPYFVLIYTEFSYFTFECGGSLISHNWVLTVAQCFDAGSTHLNSYLGIVERDIQVLDYQNGTGRFAAWESGRIATSNLHAHPNFNSTLYSNDIALMNIPLTETGLSALTHVSVIKLPTWNDAKKSFDGLTGSVSGFGFTGLDFSDRLRTIKAVPIISNAACESVLFVYITDANICTEASLTKAVCSGDEGSALVVTTNEAERVVGLASLSVCTMGYPGSFTRVSSHLEWIGSIVGTDLIEAAAPSPLKLSFLLSALALVISIIK